MKKDLTGPVVIALLFIATAWPHSANAQFFKQLLNTAKQTAQNHANDKTSQGTNGVLNKLDSSLHIKGKSSTSRGSGSSVNGSANSLPSGSHPGDTSSTHRVFGAFAQAAAANPNDTSSADLTMKALGIMVGGGGVSAADSAAAIKRFRTATGGNGVYYVYLTVVTMKGKSSRDTSYSWLTASGYGRKESRIGIAGAMSGKLVTIGHVDQPQYSMDLDPDKRTWSLQVIDTSLINAHHDTYQVTNLGNETVQGYPCIHVRLTSTFRSGAFKSSSSSDLWTSTATPGYSIYKKMTDMHGLKGDMLQALEKAGAVGFLVKMTAGDKEYTSSMQLIAADTRNCPASLFQIPAGYTQSNESAVSRLLPQSKK